MIGLIKRAYNLIRHKTRDIGLPKRSGKWPTLEKQFLKEHPECAACGTHRHLQVHHKQPYHLHPELELEPTNLIVLCFTRKNECHLRIGHGGRWSSFVAHIDSLIKQLHSGEKTYEEICKIAADTKQ